MKGFITNLAIKHLCKNDFIIINRAEIAKDRSSFKLITCVLSHFNRYNKQSIISKQN
jgi:hypothetical protein